MMPHRSYRGRIAYLRDGQGERGRETFNVTVHADGTRTVRAFCEMDDIRLLRDTTYSVDGAWRPLDAFVRLMSQDRFVGSAWFRFDDQGVECESLTALDGRVTQRQDMGRRPRLFVPHPLVCDGWQASAFDYTRGPGVQHLDACTDSSPRPDGGSGPAIGLAEKDLEYVGDEEIEVPAGRFRARHLRILPPKRDAANWAPLEIWVAGEDFQLLRMRWDVLKSTYDLVELDGDLR